MPPSGGHRTGSTLASLRQNAPEHTNRYPAEQPRLETNPRVRFQLGENAELAPYSVRPSVIGPDDDHIPPVLGPAGGSGAGGFGNQARNAYLHNAPSESHRARFRATKEEQGRAQEEALQRDYANLPRGRDTGAGVSVMQGRGNGSPHPVASQLHMPTSIIGWGCAEFHTGVAQSVTFTESQDVSASYARILLNRGKPTESVMGKPWVNEASIKKFSGENQGTTDHPVTGICAINFFNQLLMLHSSVKHETPAAKDWALRVDLLANLGDTVRGSIAVYDENASWDALVIHFLQTCGPPDILAGVYSMLHDAINEDTERNLQQRVQTLVYAWQRVQATYYGVYPERDDIPTYQQHAELKKLPTRADTSLWHQYCNCTYRRYQANPVALLQYILSLHSEARRTPVKSNVSLTYLRTGPARATQAFNTSGGPQSPMVTLPVSAARTLDKRAAASDVFVEAHRMA